MTEQGVNTETLRHQSVTSERASLEILLRVALEQWPHKSPEDQAHERRLIARDLAALEALRVC